MEKTITFSELQKKSFCNSPTLPRIVKFLESSGSGSPPQYTYKEWIGIGWIEINEPENTDKIPVVVDD